MSTDYGLHRKDMGPHVVCAQNRTCVMKCTSWCNTKKLLDAGQKPTARPELKATPTSTTK